MGTSEPAGCEGTLGAEGGPCNMGGGGYNVAQKIPKVWVKGAANAT